MIESFEVVSPRSPIQRLCSYRNATSYLQVVRVLQGELPLLERVIFPGEHWLFEANPRADLQIQSKVAHGVLIQTTSCDRYRIKTPA